MRYAALALLLSLFVATQPTGAAMPSLESQLIARAQSRLDAIASGFKAPWQRDLDPRALLVDEEGNVTTKREFLASLRPLPKGSTGTLRITYPHFALLGDLAVLTFIADEHESIYRQHFHADFAFVDTYHRTGSRWLLASEQQTRLAQEPPTVTLSTTQMQSVAGIYRMVGGPILFSVKIAHGELFGGRAGTPPVQMYAIADQPNQFFRKHHPETLIFVPGADGRAVKLIDRRYYNRDMVYERIDK